MNEKCIKIMENRRLKLPTGNQVFERLRKDNYAQPYPNAICIAMAIDDTVRQITEFRVKSGVERI